MWEPLNLGLLKSAVVTQNMFASMRGVYRRAFSTVRMPSSAVPQVFLQCSGMLPARLVSKKRTHFTIHSVPERAVDDLCVCKNGRARRTVPDARRVERGRIACGEIAEEPTNVSAEARQRFGSETGKTAAEKLSQFGRESFQTYQFGGREVRIKNRDLRAVPLDEANRGVRTAQATTEKGF